ncbi:tripartite tricarboxylate transporter TctB family protein [Pararhodobacter zhoushanensis]|uniref:Tripartite tricarboxylate transporter TctB family protein n=1 Tax=Pararhodobacter zhoushanensis TaxID=2479545 RepID=A0ABT3H557_9RHOB|nr:tripartite tricarboxylate transporter TctB family protein [Pararhodobacter zhoushanensis]MCW1934914.1 tripartite tricarboxylate transporter TctB family protein [Pararhodobacter zhoushanensis]
MNTERPLGAALLALGAGGIAVASQISVRTFNSDPGPKLFPIFACAILVICGIGLLLSKPEGEERKLDMAALLRGLNMAGLMVGYALGLWLVGFHIATLVAVFALYWVIAGAERRGWWRGLIYAVAVTGAVHLLFAVALNAFLPHGILL